MSIAEAPQAMSPAEAKATGEMSVYSEQEIAEMGPMANYMDPRRFAQMYRVANLFSQTQLVPKHFQGKPADCFLGLQFAARVKQDPLMVLQQLYIVHGKMGMQAQLAIALMNSSGLFTNPIQWRWDDGKGDDRRCYAYATLKSTGEEVSAWVSMALAKAEGWWGKDGSKWKTMPEQMSFYRSATFLGRLCCPEVLMGMRTLDELVDIGEAEVIPNRISAAELDAAISTDTKPAKEATVISTPDQKPKVTKVSRAVAQAETVPESPAAKKSFPGPLADDSEPKERPLTLAQVTGEVAAWSMELSAKFDAEVERLMETGKTSAEATIAAYVSLKDQA